MFDCGVERLRRFTEVYNCWTGLDGAQVEMLLLRRAQMGIKMGNWQVQEVGNWKFFTDDTVRIMESGDYVSKWPF